MAGAGLAWRNTVFDMMAVNAGTDNKNASCQPTMVLACNSLGKLHPATSVSN